MASHRTYLDGASLVVEIPARPPRLSTRYRGYGPFLEAVSSELRDCIAGFTVDVGGLPQLRLLLVNGATAEQLCDRVRGLAKRLIDTGLADAPFSDADFEEHGEEARLDRTRLAFAAASASAAEVIAEMSELSKHVRPLRHQGEAQALPD